MVIDLNKSRRAIEQHARRRAARNANWRIDEAGVVHIPLTRGQEALIDDVDMEPVKGYAWRARLSRTKHKKPSYYAEASVPGNPGGVVFLHNLILPPKEGCLPDHIDRNGLNCTRSNLRYANGSQNAANRDSYRSRRPYRGVCPESGSRNWIAKLMVGGKYIFRCGFKTPEEAALAYNKLAREYYGEFATLNILPDMYLVVDSEYDCT